MCSDCELGCDGKTVNPLCDADDKTKCSTGCFCDKGFRYNEGVCIPEKECETTKECEVSTNPFPFPVSSLKPLDRCALQAAL